MSFKASQTDETLPVTNFKARLWATRNCIYTVHFLIEKQLRRGISSKDTGLCACMLHSFSAYHLFAASLYLSLSLAASAVLV